MHSDNSPEILISVLRSTSFLLDHYGYNGKDPSLTELQRSIGRAMAQLDFQAQAACASSDALESQ